MKKFLCGLLAISLLVFGGCTTKSVYETENRIVAASFYPVYVFTLNLLNGIDGVEVRCMAEQNIGCLHDYSLTAKDVRLLEDAQVLVINGAGMEGFIEEVYRNAENLRIIDSSAGIELLCNSEEHSHEDKEDGEHHHEENSHIWLSLNNAKTQVENIKKSLVEAFPEYEKEISSNYNSYIKRINRLEEVRDGYSKEISGKTAISFHSAYEYLAAETGLVILDTVESDEGGEPSAKKLTELCEEIEHHSIKALFTEPTYEGNAADILSAETGVEVFVLNPVTKGDGSLTSYEDIMKSNYEIIYKAVK
ncbi:MAG: zinc ABC transporter substrate-binding protein [Oscillospiraceae bacterium]|nr:zinc ABC transporter substrate-binding protein [Oscillospiraceae bacterium]